MANVGCEKRGRSRSRDLILVMFLVLLTAEQSQALPFNPSFMEGVQSEVVNPFNRTILSRFNLTEEQIQRIQNRSNPNMRDEASQSSNQLYLQQVATQRLNEIIKRVQKAITNDPNSSTTKEKAGFPICNAETTIPEEWQLGTNVTLKFANSVFVHNDDRLTSAVLRLYKTYPGHNPQDQVPVPTEPTERTSSQCPDQPQAGPQIRVTVSIVHQQKKNRKLERKKRTCNTTMLSSAMTGWVEIDVKCALAYWEQQMRQEEQQQQRHSQQQQQLAASVVGMLMIEVHDDEENPLRPGLYFAPPTCDQAEIAVPWSAYGTESLKPDLESWTVPRNPRLDVFFHTIPSFNSGVKTIYISPKIKSYGMETTTSGSPAIDNQLDGVGEKESQEREHRRHHLSESSSGSDSESSQVETGIGAEELFSSASNSEQMEPISNHHRQRSGQHHHHHHHHHHTHQLQQHHHYQRHHHKHHKMTHKPE
ncbi:protein anachronism isoform X1 [Drosophila bipectinata]|uniref:protein anachronism isoform X1 n=1 Tax=Drosophila bipectinata TaxID=42026 RepID=UPI001C89D45C|nr:protein anachronism isoform X1 [Drosophila bipectinata]